MKIGSLILKDAHHQVCSQENIWWEVIGY